MPLPINLCVRDYQETLAHCVGVVGSDTAVAYMAIAGKLEEPSNPACIAVNGQALYRRASTVGEGERKPPEVRDREGVRGGIGKGGFLKDEAGIVMPMGRRERDLHSHSTRGNMSFCCTVRPSQPCSAVPCFTFAFSVSASFLNTVLAMM